MYMFRIQRGNFISMRFLFFSDSCISWINTHRNYIKNNISSNTHGIDNKKRNSGSNDDRWDEYSKVDYREQSNSEPG
ncbi:unnamed protein product [Schistosoma mattheei]|uniref:Uncharacterized protein n=1 Tax=Schistosoma mattheei TaxID=31246 RepID=A0A183PCD4_9TREM|nr:unnamed protein product [Schistosoma mattheei]